LNVQVAQLRQVIADALEAVEAGAPREECLRILRNA
jgi:antitoxin (DNA-binding transcriptional repressor) of toxin-antitoxin stability system